ncbi:MAG: regulatory iron-sulfur-containing complex subunit RicT [Pirellulaceae bacterium]|jgi:cell fate regulator YaaT (PSP1 superfamily)|nr:regulatory iron-sulfur-containing complex subunit RicT [Pirellulaceae bacterium]
MRLLGIFTCPAGEVYQRGDDVILRTSRGLEAGDILCQATTEETEQFKDAPGGQVVRVITSSDRGEISRIQKNTHQDFQRCKKLVEKLGLGMELADIEHVFGGERVIVYYLAEDRVDFRELVRQLASEFQTRIEMKQIGVRDEAKLLADYGDCGKPVCCNTHLSHMPPVSMKMAKLQKATLDPTKISGRCGRLKCCLRYEFETYEAMRDELPPIGFEVITSSGRGTVLRHEILTQQILVEMEDHRRTIVALPEILTVLEKKGGGGSRKRQ